MGWRFFKGKPVDPLPDRCVFCQICNGQHRDTTTIVYENDRIVVFPDIAPAGKAHFQVVPRRHILNANALQPGNTEDLELGGC